MLRFENVGMRYGVGPEILRDINFALEPGSFHFLTGPSGAGKTTLLKLMYLALRPTRGLVHLLDRDISLTPRSELPELRRQIGVVFQEFRLIDHLSAVENVALPLREHTRLSPAELPATVTSHRSVPRRSGSGPPPRSNPR